MRDLLRLPCLRLNDTDRFSGTDLTANDNSKHSQAAMDWLCHAHDINNDSGVSYQYSFRKGWGPSYPETTGYIIPTFFDYHSFTGQDEYKETAIKMANWLLSIQLACGGFRQRAEDCRPSGGVDLQGLLRRSVGTYESRGIKRACANRIGRVCSIAKQQKLGRKYK